MEQLNVFEGCHNPIKHIKNDNVFVVLDPDEKDYLLSHMDEVDDRTRLLLNEEITRATGAESVLHERINQEVSTSAEADADLNRRISDEISRATEEERVLGQEISKLIAEDIRLIGEDEILHNAIGDEVVRAKNAENALSGRINNLQTEVATNEEVTARAVVNLNTRLTTTQENLQSATLELNSTKQDVADKTNDIANNIDSTDKYPSAKGVADYIDQKIEEYDPEGTEEVLAESISNLNERIEDIVENYSTKEELAASVATSSATFRGTFNLISDLSLNINAETSLVITKLDETIFTKDNNDYCYILIPTSADLGAPIKRVDRYKYDGSDWSFEYSLNNSGFTSDQWNAINSYITSSLVEKLNALPNNLTLTNNLNAKADLNNNLLTLTARTVGVMGTGTNNGLRFLNALGGFPWGRIMLESYLKDYGIDYLLPTTGVTEGSIVTLALKNDWNSDINELQLRMQGRSSSFDGENDPVLHKDFTILETPSGTDAQKYSLKQANDYLNTLYFALSDGKYYRGNVGGAPIEINQSEAQEVPRGLIHIDIIGGCIWVMSMLLAYTNGLFIQIAFGADNYTNTDAGTEVTGGITLGSKILIRKSDYSVSTGDLVWSNWESVAYIKPSTGIPKSDLTSSVLTSLGKADTALQSHQDISGKANIVDGKVQSVDGIEINSHESVATAVTVPFSDDYGQTYYKRAILKRFADNEVVVGDQYAHDICFEYDNKAVSLTNLVASAACADTAYQKPQSGIPESDLTRELQQTIDNVPSILQYISAISDLVPEQASSSNQLADKNFVNSSIQTNTAEFKGTRNLVTDLSLTTSATQQQIAAALASAISNADNNDYCFVQIPTDDATPTQIARVDRYKYNGSAWLFEWSLNNSSFTAAQWAAINSTVTSGDVDKLRLLPTKAQLDTLFAAKQNTLISGTNIKTINNQSVLGSGNLDVKDIFWVEYDQTPFADILNAYNAGKTLFANYAGTKFVNIYVETNNDNITTFIFSSLVYDAESAVAVIGFAVILEGDTTIYSDISITDMQTLIDSSNKLNADHVDDTTTTNKFITAAERTLWNTVTEKAPLPFVVNAGIDPEGVLFVNKTLAELETAHNAGKTIRVQFASASGISFEEDATRINEPLAITYVTHAVSGGKHYIVTIYDDSGTTKARFETVDDNAYAKYNDGLINSITPTIAASTVTIDGYALHPSEETFVVKPYQKIAFSDTYGDCQLYIIDATNPNAKTIISQKSHLITWDNQSDTDITIQVGINNVVPGTFNVSTYWRGIDNVFIAEYNVTSISEIQSAVDSGRVVMCRAIESGDIVYYQLSQSSSAFFTFFRFVGARYYRIILNKSTGVWYTFDNLLQSTSNMDSSIDSSASTTHYPSTKAVADYVSAIVGNINSILETI